MTNTPTSVVSATAKARIKQTPKKSLRRTAMLPCFGQGGSTRLVSLSPINAECRTVIKKACASIAEVASHLNVTPEPS